MVVQVDYIRTPDIIPAMTETTPLTPYEGRVKAFEDYAVEVAARFDGDEAYQILALGEKLVAGALTNNPREIERLRTEINDSLRSLKGMNNRDINLALQDIQTVYVSYTVL